MTNGKKLLGASIFVFLAITVGSVAFASEPAATTAAVEQEQPDHVEMYSRPYDEYYVYALIAEVSDGLAAKQQQDDAKKASATSSAQASKAVAPNYDPGDGSRWDQLAQCESGGNWAYPPVSGGFSGGIMFHIGTWRSMGGEEFAPDAYLATREQQIIVAERTLAAAGGRWTPWPGCSRKFGWL